MSRLRLRHALLEIDGAAQRLGDALEFDQHAVAGRLDDAPLAPRNRRIDELEPHRLQAGERPCLVRFHETAVADHVRRNDCREPAIGFVRFHLAFDPVGDSIPRSDCSVRTDPRTARSRTRLCNDHASPGDAANTITPAAAVQPRPADGLGLPFLTAPLAC